MDLLHATILVLVVTNQRILLAADSRKTYLDKKGIYRIDTIDKIYQTKDFYYAVSGFHEEEGCFSLHKLIHEQLLLSSSLFDTVSSLAQVLATALKTYFGELKKSSPAVFQQVMRQCAFGGEIFIVGQVEHIPTAYLIDYRISDSASLKITNNTWSININSIKGPESCFWRAIGNTPVLSSTFLSEKEWALYPDKKAKMLIEEGAKRNPELVSNPINMLELTECGIKWIEKTQTAPNKVNN